MPLGELPCRRSMVFWLVEHGVDRSCCGRWIVEQQQAAVGAEMTTQAGVVMNHRSTTREVARAAVTEPATYRSDVEILRDTELAGAVLNVRPKRIGCACTVRRARKPVSPAQQCLAIVGVGCVDVERELDRRSDVGR